MNTHVIITARNETDSVGATIDALSAALPGVDLVVADDHSIDNTVAEAEAHGARVVDNSSGQGKGQAATGAVRSLLDREDTGGMVLFCDADLGSSAELLTKLLEAVDAGDADIAVARFKKKIGGGVGLARGFAEWAIKRLTGKQLDAPISGQRAVRSEVLKDVLPFASGFGMEMGMTVDALRAGHTLIEIEIDLEHRSTGRNLHGFHHRARQLKDFLRAYASRRKKVKPQGHRSGSRS